jgi:hypothetical protein
LKDHSTGKLGVPYILLDRYNGNHFFFLSLVLDPSEHSTWFDSSSELLTNPPSPQHATLGSRFCSTFQQKIITKPCTEAADGAFLRGKFLSAAW